MCFLLQAVWAEALAPAQQGVAVIPRQTQQKGAIQAPRWPQDTRSDFFALLREKLAPLFPLKARPATLDRSSRAAIDAQVSASIHFSDTSKLRLQVGDKTQKLALLLCGLETGA